MGLINTLFAPFRAFLNLLFSSPVRVEGDSMMPTLKDRQLVLVVRPMFPWNRLRRGDVVVLMPPGPTPGLPDGTWFIKRVAGMPDEEIVLAGGSLYADDVLLAELPGDAALPAVLALSVCAMLSGARSLYAIAQWGREHPQFAQLLGFSRKRTPCVATLHHVFRRLDVDSFESALGRWAQECLGEGEATIAIDGKALRGIHGGELPGVRLVAAYAGESGLVLGQSGGQGWRLAVR